MERGDLHNITLCFTDRFDITHHSQMCMDTGIHNLLAKIENKVGGTKKTHRMLKKATGDCVWSVKLKNKAIMHFIAKLQIWKVFLTGTL